MAILEPADIVEDGDGAGLDAAVIAIDRLSRLTVASLKFLAFCSAANSSTSS